MTEAALGVRYLIIDAESDGQRLDNFLMKHLRSVPKSLIYRIIRSGEVRVDAKRAKPMQKLSVGERVRIPPVSMTVPEKPDQLAGIAYLEDKILFEDQSLLILDKPHGLAVHGGSGAQFGVIEALRQLRPSQHLELVHRLDKDTSGCLILSKNRKTLVYCHELLRTKKLQKTYYALVEGEWPRKQCLVDLPLLKNVLRSGERVVSVNTTGKASQTEVKVLRRLPGVTLLELKPLTGRTHQLRVHCAASGHPILGDPKYGDARIAIPSAKKRLYLHAHALNWRNQVDEQMAVSSPMPDEFNFIINALGDKHQVKL